jgi:cytosine/adenosine deaminase-related metal-dependent hydrolase
MTQMAKFWPLISANAVDAAGAVGHEDCGPIAPNYQADFLLYHIPDNPPQMVAGLRKDESIQLLESWRF